MTIPSPRPIVKALELHDPKPGLLAHAHVYNLCCAPSFYLLYRQAILCTRPTERVRRPRRSLGPRPLCRRSRPCQRRRRQRPRLQLELQHELWQRGDAGRISGEHKQEDQGRVNTHFCAKGKEASPSFVRDATTCTTPCNPCCSSCASSSACSSYLCTSM